MKNHFNQLFAIPSLFFVAISMQGCGDSLPKINEENCANIGNERTQYNFQETHFKTETQWDEFKNQCKNKKLGRYKFLDYQDDHEVNKENCDKLYLSDNSFSEEYKKNFSNDLGWRRFASSCHDLDKSKPSPYKSWLP